MKLKEYIYKKHIQAKFLAQDLNMSEATMYKLMNGLADPRISTILAIEEITDGYVTVKDWVLECKDKRKNANQDKNETHN
jgi:hypothetical protein